MMMHIEPYELIVTAASRPHLLQPTLQSLLMHVDHWPTRILIHDDAVQPDQWVGTQKAVEEAILAVSAHAEVDWHPEVLLHQADPPRRLGLALNWLLANVTTDYALYSQDDFVTVRSLPILAALDVMATHGLHQMRFNKRATMQFKETWAGVWEKAARTFAMPTGPITCTISDHWYFQTSLWRVSEIRRALAFWTETLDRRRRLAADEPEGLINYFFDHLAYGGDPDSHAVRAACQKTFIWGPIGEDRYVRHIGGSRDDWRGNHARQGAIDEAATAWREIRSYPGTHPTEPER